MRPRLLDVGRETYPTLEISKGDATATLVMDESALGTIEAGCAELRRALAAEERGNPDD